jgi:hypothetical protein
MKLPSYLDLALLPAAIPPREPVGGEPVVIDNEDFLKQNSTGKRKGPQEKPDSLFGR